MFSGDMINSLRLITDLHKMIQLIKKLLTGTMHLDKNFIQSRLRNIRIHNIHVKVYLDQSVCDMYDNNFNFLILNSEIFQIRTEQQKTVD